MGSNGLEKVFPGTGSAPLMHNPENQETTLSCLHVVLEEEWEHHRYAVRDLDAIEAESDA